MIQTEATLTAILDRFAVLEFTASACSACRSGKGCGAGLLGAGRQVRVALTQLPEQVKVGSQVTVHCAPETLLRAAVLGYGLPLFGLLLLSSVAAACGLSETWVVLGAVLGAASGLVAGRFGGRRAPKLRLAMR
ncbi:MAG: SoxR reducing system RseC family protein [Pseudomonadota bacterium]